MLIEIPSPESICMLEAIPEAEADTSAFEFLQSSLILSAVSPPESFAPSLSTA